MVIVQLIGGAGNQMFQYACARHLALLNDTVLKVDTSFIENRMPVSKYFTYRNYDLDIYNVKHEFATNEDIPLYPKNWKINSIPQRLINYVQVRSLGFQYILEWPFNSYNRIRFNSNILKKRGNLYLAGYNFSPLYFNDIREVIKDDFRIIEKPLEVSNGLYDKINNSNSVCIHVRRTDFLNVKAIGFHGIDYFTKAISVLESLVKDPVYFIFSDDLDWCKSNLNIKNEHYFIGSEHIGLKCSNYLNLMRSCKYYIIANSSFSWWPAWLSDYPNKIVIVPENYFAELNTIDLIPEDWIKLKYK